MKTTSVLDPLTSGVVSLLNHPGFTSGGIASRPLFQAPGVRVVWMGLDAGQELTEHTTPKRALVEILEGVCDFQLADEWQRLGAGDLVHLTPGAVHALKAVTRTAILLILIPESVVPTPSVQPKNPMSLVAAED